MRYHHCGIPTKRISREPYIYRNSRCTSAIILPRRMRCSGWGLMTTVHCRFGEDSFRCGIGNGSHWGSNSWKERYNKAEWTIRRSASCFHWGSWSTNRIPADGKIVRPILLSLGKGRPHVAINTDTTGRNLGLRGLAGSLGWLQRLLRTGWRDGFTRRDDVDYLGAVFHRRRASPGTRRWISGPGSRSGALHLSSQHDSPSRRLLHPGPLYGWALPWQRCRSSADFGGLRCRTPRGLLSRVLANSGIKCQRSSFVRQGCWAQRVHRLFARSVTPFLARNNILTSLLSWLTYLHCRTASFSKM